MTPPIFTPDGAEVEEVILPDGSEASEVIAPDGTVVFEGDTIPDSVVNHMTHWYPVDEGAGAELFETLSGDERDQDIEGATWETNANRWDGVYLSYDSDYTVSQTQYGLNSSQVSAVLWFKFNEVGDFDQGVIGATDNNDLDGPSNGWHLVDRDNSDITLMHADSGATNSVATISNIDDDTWYFAGISIDGNSASFHLWDENDHVADNSGSADRGQTSDALLVTGRRGGFTRFLSGGVDAHAVNANTDLDKADFTEIWEDTKPE